MVNFQCQSPVDLHGMSSFDFQMLENVTTAEKSCQNFLMISTSFFVTSIVSLLLVFVFTKVQHKMVAERNNLPTLVLDQDDYIDD